MKNAVACHGIFFVLVRAASYRTTCATRPVAIATSA